MWPEVTPGGRDAQEGLYRLSDWPRVCPQTWAVAWHTLPQLSPPGWQGGLLNPILWVRAALSQTPTPGHIVTASLESAVSRPGPGFPGSREELSLCLVTESGEAQSTASDGLAGAFSPASLAGDRWLWPVVCGLLGQREHLVPVAGGARAVGSRSTFFVGTLVIE